MAADPEAYVSGAELDFAYLLRAPEERGRALVRKKPEGFLIHA